MSMPERSGYKVDGGWAAGTDNLNGTTVPQQLTVDSRTGTPLPTEYKASTFIEFITGFTSGTGDEFLAYIATGTNTPGGSSGGTGSENVYRYGFNGKENDKDISEGGQDYGMRIYDSRLGRFLSVDPLTKSYPMLTPYQFASNSPIQNVDLDGKEGTRYQLQINGNAWVEIVNLKVYVNVTNNAAYANGIFAGNAFENKNTIINEMHSYLNESYNQGRTIFQIAEQPITKNETLVPVYYSFTVIPIETTSKADYNNKKNTIREESPTYDDFKLVDGASWGRDFLFVSLEDQKAPTVASHRGDEVNVDPKRYQNRNSSANDLVNFKMDISHEVGHDLLKRNPNKNFRSFGKDGASSLFHNLVGGFMSYGNIYKFQTGEEVLLGGPTNNVSPNMTDKVLESVTPIPNFNTIINAKKEDKPI